MITKIKNLPFSVKLLIIIIISMSLGVSLVTAQQISTASKLMEQEKVNNLTMITEQMALHFSQNQRSIENEIYDRTVSFDIPSLMYSYNTDPTVGVVELRDMVTQMITTSTPYDFIVVRTDKGAFVGADKVYTLGKGRHAKLLDESIDLLKAHEITTYGGAEWVRTVSDETYIIRDIYDVSPLSHVGTMAIHLKNDFFSISQAYIETGFFFFDSYGNHITSAGDVVDDAILEQVIHSKAIGSIASENEWNDSSYFAAQSSAGGWVTVGVASMNAYQAAKRKILYEGVVFGLIGMLLGIAAMFLLNSSLRRKLHELLSSMDKIAEGDFGYQIEIRDNDDISQLAITFNYMSHHIEELLKQLVEKERYRHEAELQILEYKLRSLETQIRPHFIYNALETISATAKLKGDEDMVDIVQRISRYFRFITVISTHQFISTQQEFDYLQDYTEIYKYIHGKQLVTHFSAKEIARSAMIPTMIIQPVVENALQHGLRGQQELSEVIVHAYVEDQHLVITVKDRGYGLSDEQLRQMESGSFPERNAGRGIGLSNVRERLKLLYGDDASLTMANRANGGVKVTVRIPFAYSEAEIEESIGEIDIFEDLDD